MKSRRRKRFGGRRKKRLFTTVKRTNDQLCERKTRRNIGRESACRAREPAAIDTPAPGLLTHWVVLYAKEGNDYLMLDPWPYQTDVTKKTYLMPRYSQGNPLKRSIMHVIIYESFNASGGIAQPGSSTTTSTPQTPPVTGPVAQPTSSSSARVKAGVTWGLNIRSSIDTSSTSNIVVSAPAGSVLTMH